MESIARVAASPRASLNGIPADTNDEPRYRPARLEARSNQRLNVPLGSPPSVAVGSLQRVPPTEAARPKIDSLRMNAFAAPVKL